MTRQAKSRGWCFTINNPTFGDTLDIEALKHAARYVIWGNEVGQDNGTPHFQGFTYFANAVTMARIKQILRRAHLEPQRGTVNQAIEYCKKDGDWEEHGDKPVQGGGNSQRERWRILIKLAEDGEWEQVKHDFPGEWIRYGKRLLELRKRKRHVLDGDLEHEWWYGPTGTGKSKTLWELYPEHYAKELNKWWDGYCDEDVVAIEEWAPKNECTASFLKIWADRYPFPAQIKGGTIHGIRPRKIIVLSNYTIEQCFTNEEDREPIKRRFKVKHFPYQSTPQTTTEWVNELDTIEALLNLSQ
uniref:Putative rep protein n=1 Tax=uncultured virus TaxID=340016 RepID=A0A1D8MK54_9VIRU|nr:putative rep protein [uncultured virus]